MHAFEQNRNEQGQQYFLKEHEFMSFFFLIFHVTCVSVYEMYKQCNKVKFTRLNQNLSRDIYLSTSYKQFFNVRKIC